jgi:hypothetical protein
MLSIAKARKDYYLRKLGEISAREDYYLRGGTAVGYWQGRGAAEAGLKGSVTAEGLVRLFDGQHPATGEQLGRKLRKDGVAAWDLTFSADKSVSLLWAFGDAEVRRHVVEAFEEATVEALTYLESVASSTRGASRTPVLDSQGQPVVGDDGRPRLRIETWPIRTGGYVAAWFTEFTSRADDPQLHTHVVVGNRVEGVDGVWRALDGRLLYIHKLDAGYIHEAELRSRLTERLGVRWQPVRNGVADIEGFTREQIMAFSQRKREIEQWRSEHGLADTAAANEVATLATRAPKQDHPLGALREQWIERGREVGLTPESVARLLSGGRTVTPPPTIERLFTQMASPDGLTAQASTFSRADAIKTTAAALPEGGRRRDIVTVADSFLGRSEVIPILPYQPVDDLTVDVPFELDPDELDTLLELAASTNPPTMRRRDGVLFPGLVNERRYTTAELLATEQRVINRALDGVDAGRWAVPGGRVDAALEAHPDLTEGQRAMVHRFATSGDAIAVGVGAAGTGKTTVMSIIDQLAGDTEIPIIGTALAARAAAGFETSTGISSSTITRFLWETDQTGGLPKSVIVIVDEAGMVGSRHLAAISDLVEAASGKLILIGDHHQLAEIDAGGLFTALATRLHAVELTENVRQTQEWERTALTELRHGSASRAIGMYDRRRRIGIAKTSEEVMARAVDAWYRDVTEVGDPSKVLLIGDRNDNVHRLNRRARDLMAQSGQLSGPALTTSERTFRSGDRVVCLKNRNSLGVLNGDLATVTAVDPDSRSITLLLDRIGKCTTVAGWYLDEGHLDWGYAVTGHKAQGATAQRVHTVAGDRGDREWIYVTMSRGRETNTIYLTQPDLDEDECTHIPHHHAAPLPALIKALDRTSAQPAALDSGRGPHLLTDKQLSRRIAEVETRQTDGGPGEQRDLGEYANLIRESEARSRDRLAILAYTPPPWLAKAMGERPADPRRRQAWDRVAERSLRYREAHGVPKDEEGLIGSQPDNRGIEQWAEWSAWHRSVKRDLATLNAADDRGLGLLSAR